MRYKELTDEEKKEFYEKYYEIQRSDKEVYVDIWPISMKMATVGDVVYIGNTQIGIVFDVGKETIKIVHFSEGKHLKWCTNSAFGYERYIGTTDNDGSRNMEIIRQACGDFNNDTLYPAFGYIRSLGKEWYMPAKDELNLIYKNKDIINNALKILSRKEGWVVDLYNDWYWSSSSYNTHNAWGQSFSDGHQYNYLKYDHDSVRAVRALTI